MARGSRAFAVLARPRFGSQHPHGSSQPAVTILPGDVHLLLACKATRRVHGTQLYMQSKHR